MTNEKIDAIVLCINNRKMIEAKKLLKNLDEELSNLENLQKFYEEMYKICRELGKTNMINKDEIEELLREYKAVNEVKK